MYLVVLAGGSGTRFWPKSRHLRPKQLCHIGDSKLTMIEQTLARFDGVIPKDRRMIVTHHEQMSETRKIVGQKCGTYLAEPAAKNTANALALAAIEIENMHKKSSSDLPAIMVSVHADHIITGTDKFIADIQTAIRVAETDQLTLLSATPDYPETGYGYIESGEVIQGIENAFKVSSFKEKPDFDTAKEYLDKGGYFWNTGLFIWRTSVLLSELREYLPASVEKLQKLVANGQSYCDVDFDVLSDVYLSLPKIAIDNAVLEQSQKVSVVKTSFGWKDVGSWDALHQIFPLDENGNYQNGDAFLLDCKNITVDSDGPFIAGIGCEDLVIVAAKNAVLVCPKSRAQDVKRVVEYLKDNGRQEFL